MGLQTRAYVRTFVGLHGSALEDLQLAESRFPNEESPSWSGLLGRVCHFDLEGIDELVSTDEKLKPAGAFLKSQISRSTNMHDVRAEAVTEMLSVDPGCLQAVAVMGDGGPIGMMAFSASEGLPRLGALLARTLSKWSELPQGSRRLAASLQPQYGPPDSVALAKLIASLRTLPADSAELQWGSLAALVEEACFAQAVRQLVYKVSWLSVPVQETHAYWRPVLQGHRYAGFLACMHGDKPVARQQALAAIETVDKTLLDVSAGTMSDYFRNLKAYEGSLASNMEKNSDKVYRDLVFKLHTYTLTSNPVAANELIAVSPHCPAGVAAAIMFDWGSTESKLADWDEQFVDSAQVSAALGRRYLDTARYSDAERVLKRTIALHPDQEGYQLLAIAYEYTKNADAWLETKKASLEVPCLGLEHASTCRDLAAYYINRKEYAAARPYAERAAESYSGWGLQIAANCCQLQEDWEQAEMYQRMLSERYETSSLEWFKFCCRTGRGDREAAWKLAGPFAESIIRHPDSGYRQNAALCLFLADQIDEALPVLEKLAKSDNQRFSMVLGALAAEQAGRPELREELLRMVIEQSHKESNNYLVDVAKWMQKYLHKPEAALLDADMLEWIIHYPMNDGVPTKQMYLIGKSLLLRGEVERAVPYLQRAATSPLPTEFGCILAGDALHELGILPQAPRDSEIDAGIVQALREWFYCLQLQSGGKTEQALEGLTNVIASAPELPEGYFSRGLTYQQSARLDEAHADLEHAVEMLPNAPDVRCRFARLLEAMQRHEEALAQYEAALAIDPQCGLALIGQVYLRAACLDPAFRDAQAALQFAKQAAETGDLPAFEVWNVLAAAHSAAGDFSEANRYVAQALAVATATEKPEVERRAALYKQNQPYQREADWWK